MDGAGLGAALRAQRVAAGLTQEQLAGLSGLSVRAIGDLERGRVSKPRRESIQLLTEALRLDSNGYEELMCLAGHVLFESALEPARCPRTCIKRTAEEPTPLFLVGQTLSATRQISPRQRKKLKYKANSVPHQSPPPTRPELRPSSWRRGRPSF